MIPWICSHCSKEFPVLALTISRKVPCPHCGMSVDIPALIKKSTKKRFPAFWRPKNFRGFIGAILVLVGIFGIIRTPPSPFIFVNYAFLVMALVGIYLAGIHLVLMNEVMNKWSAYTEAINNFDWVGSVRTLSILVGLVGWIVTIQTPPSPFVLVHYAFLLMALVGIYLVFVNTWSAYKKAIKIAGFVFGFSIVSLYAIKYDSFESHWTSDYGNTYIDTYKRWGDEFAYRRITFKDGGFCHGPMKGEGHPKQHGKWTCLGKWFRDGLEYTFYWYGEEVSEGEWNLRNK